MHASFDTTASLPMIEPCDISGERAPGFDTPAVQFRAGTTGLCRITGGGIPILTGGIELVANITRGKCLGVRLRGAGYIRAFPGRGVITRLVQRRI